MTDTYQNGIISQDSDGDYVLEKLGTPNAKGLPVIVKGVNCAEDVEVALTAGADGVYVTNHGGREIDGAPATIDVLPEVVEAVNGRSLPGYL